MFLIAYSPGFYTFKFGFKIDNEWCLQTTFFLFFLKSFCWTRFHFVWATGTLSFEFRMILHMGFKARVDSSSSVFLCSLCAMITSHLWLPLPGIESESPTCEASTIPLRQPYPWKPCNNNDAIIAPDFYGVVIVMLQRRLHVLTMCISCLVLDSKLK